MARKKAEFAPPSVEEVKKYCDERKNGINAEQFVNYYTVNGWKIGKNKMKDWKLAIRSWEIRMRKSENDEKTKSRGLTRYERSELESRLQRMMLEIIDVIGMSKELEKCETPIERSMFIGLWLAKIKWAIDCEKSLTGGTQVKSQQEIESTPYRADFMLYDYHTDTRMIVECDGREYHHSSQEIVNHDYQRERDIKCAGYEVVRFTGSEIYKDFERCAKQAMFLFKQLVIKKERQ